ncbi:MULTISPECIES: hypothetical protein [unclassified Streptomyces]|uniref:hypothetical protein n=1 Tax=unclassified Streptomyces TaxID=2593676 RepID=UPI0006BFD66D|nr:MULTISPECIES: hypothetical protein [unclassified Streptomyces]KOU96338.1 hypothetical protein ADK93_04160 [Streptomyces sp. XY58]KOV11918.1 hypothetical protein ADK89_03545 [Streptomyces sp. XY37]KOV55109.1 hypothetical protein ADK99_04680 [Streptomyces sp. MMG1064]
MGRRTTREVEAEPGDEKLDLSVAQVAGSSLATVAAALLASKLGVYGTILGAGVVSVVATAGGPVIQHLFRRTGDQLRDSARPKARQGPAPLVEDRPAAPRGEFGEPTVHGTRMRGWKRTAVASGAAFALAIGGLGTYEAVAGTSVSSGGGTLFSRGTRTADRDRPAPPEHGPADGEKERRGGAGDPGTGASPSPSRPHGDRSPGPGPDPAPSHSGDPSPGPSPSTHGPTPAPTPPGPDPAPTPSTDRTTPTPSAAS